MSQDTQDEVPIRVVDSRALPARVIWPSCDRCGKRAKVAMMYLTAKASEWGSGAGGYYPAASIKLCVGCLRLALDACQGETDAGLREDER